MIELGIFCSLNEITTINWKIENTQEIQLILVSLFLGKLGPPIKIAFTKTDIIS